MPSGASSSLASERLPPKEKHDRLQKGLGHRTSVIAYLLATLVAVDHPPDATTSALVQYLLAREDPEGGWRDTLQRPPGQGSSFTVTALTLMGLNRYGAHTDLKPQAARIQDSRKKVASTDARKPSWVTCVPPTHREHFRSRRKLRRAHRPNDAT
jgi:hypothetical protein